MLEQKQEIDEVESLKQSNLYDLDSMLEAITPMNRHGLIFDDEDLAEDDFLCYKG